MYYKNIFILLSSVFFIGCSTKIPITNINTNSLIKNKNESVLISSYNQSDLLNIKNNLIRDLSNNGVLINQPFNYEFVLNDLQHNVNVFNYQSQQEVLVKDEYCEKMRRYNNYDNKQNGYKKDNKYNYNNYKNNYYDNHNKQNNECMVRAIEILNCYSVETKSMLITDTIFLKQQNKIQNIFEAFNKKDICLKQYENYDLKSLEYENINTNIYNLKEQVYDYISPNISQVYLNIYEEVESLKLNDDDNDKFEKSVDLIDDKNFNTAKTILIDLYNNSKNRYGKIPYEITFNLAIIYENLNQLNEAKKYYQEIKEINVNNHILRVEKLTNFRK